MTAVEDVEDIDRCGNCRKLCLLMGAVAFDGDGNVEDEDGGIGMADGVVGVGGVVVIETIVDVVIAGKVVTGCLSVDNGKYT